VNGVLGVNPGPSYAVYPNDRSPEYRPHRIARVSMHSSHRGTRHSPSS
jgi:hypothetical protein